jgi:hypothetical protein
MTFKLLNEGILLEVSALTPEHIPSKEKVTMVNNFMIFTVILLSTSKRHYDRITKLRKTKLDHFNLKHLTLKTRRKNARNIPH